MNTFTRAANVAAVMTYLSTATPAEAVGFAAVCLILSLAAAADSGDGNGNESGA